MGKANRNTYNDDDHYDSDETPYTLGDPSCYRNENPWIDVFGYGAEAETAYWNTN